MNEQRKIDNDAVAFRIIKSVVLAIVALTPAYFYSEKNNSNITDMLRPLVGIIFIILATIMVLAWKTPCCRCKTAEPVNET